MGKKNKPQGKPQRLLVIRLSALGDVAMCVPVILSLTLKFPQLGLTVLSKAEFGAIFDGLPGVDFYAAQVKGNHNGITGLYRLYKALKNHQINAVADLHGVIRSHVLDGFFKTRGVPVAKIDKGRKDKKKLTHATPKDLYPLKPTIARYAEVFKDLGYPIDLSQDSFLPKKKLSTFTQSLFKKTSEKHIGIAPFAAHEGKQYPLPLMQQVIADLNESKNTVIFLFGGGSNEIEKMDELAKNFAQVQNLAGRFDLAQELEIISNLDLMLTMDSGNGHLAAMYGVPVITLWGVTHPYLGFAPYAQCEENQLMADREQFPLIPTSVYGNKVPAGYERAMETIKPAVIISRIKYILEKD